MYTQLTYCLHVLVAFLHKSLMLSFITQPVLADLKESSSNCVWSSLQPDPEELCTFTDLYGPLRLLLSFQVHPFSVTLDPPDFFTKENKNINIFSTGSAGYSVMNKDWTLINVITVRLLITNVLPSLHPVKMKLAACLGPDWCSRVEDFLHTFSLANAGVGPLSFGHA